MYVFIEVSARACTSTCVYTTFLKNFWQRHKRSRKWYMAEIHQRNSIVVGAHPNFAALPQRNSEWR
jgi:hypothetical protein